MFVMLNDGGRPEDTDHDMVTRVLVQRNFVFGLLTSGVDVTLLHGAEFRDSKVGRLRPIAATFIWIRHRCFLSYLREDLASIVTSHFQLPFGTPCKIVLPNLGTSWEIEFPRCPLHLCMPHHQASILA